MSFLGNIYHPILHRIRNSNFYNRKKIELMIQNSYSEGTKQKRRIYVDITSVSKNNGGTGIPRVSKEVSKRLINIQNCNFEIRNVISNNYEGFVDSITKQQIVFSPDDIFFGLDYSIYYAYKYKQLFDYLRSKGIKISFFIHDLISFRYPEFCKPKFIKGFYKFFKQIINYDQILCNSISTAEDVSKYLFSENHNLKFNKCISIKPTPLGSNFSVNSESSIFNANHNSDISFLMVSTVEPKKKYDQAVKAFDILWKKGLNVELKIVGRKGWKADETFKLIENNTEYNKKLFWYNTGISDEELAKLYKQTDCVVMTSLIEGFGLAVTEAALFGKPLIIRNIPVFKEIAGENAFYFDGLEPEKLAEKIEEWISLYREHNEPDSSKIKFRESVKFIL